MNKKIVLILFIIAINITCKQNEGNNKSLSKAKKYDADSDILPKLFEDAKQDTSYYKAEIYCWCFGGTPLYRKKDGSTVMRGQFCETPIIMNPTDLIMPERLYISLTDKSSVNKLKNLFY